MQQFKINISLLLLIFIIIISCNSSKKHLQKIYQNPNSHLALYINLYINYYDVQNKPKFGDDICYPTQTELIIKNRKAASLHEETRIPFPKNSNFDSTEVIEFLLDNMIVGGKTNFMEKYLLSTTDGAGNYFSQHHKRRVDFAIMYFLYYSFYLNEDISKFHNIVLVNSNNSVSHCYPAENAAPIYGSPSNNYSITPYQDSMLLTILNCYKEWIKKIKQIGFSESKKSKISPFTKCSCAFRRIHNDKEHFSRFPRTE